MPLYIDSTEARKGSRLPSNVIGQSSILYGLESSTGADMLISLEPVKTDRINPHAAKTIAALDRQYHGPQQLAHLAECTLPEALGILSFIHAVESGLLVQRKSGRDMSSSVPKLTSVLQRMLLWTDKPWLLFVGDLKCSRQGEAVIDGGNTGFSYNAVQGAIESWMLRGGCYTMLSRDSLIMPWCARWLDKLRALQQSKMVVKRPAQGIVQGKAWLSTLMTLPEIGSKRGRLLADHYGTLAGCVETIVDLHFPDYSEKVGIRSADAKRIVGECRKWFGMSDIALEFQLMHKGDHTGEQV